MKYLAYCGFWALTMAAGALASVDGTVVNATTGKPAAGVTVLLVKPGQGGMRTLGTTTSDASGHFAFAKDEPGGGPQLLQADFEGVHYNTLLTPGMPTSNVEVNIYAATKSPSVARVAQHFVLIEPSKSQIAVSETVLLQNDSKTTYSDDTLGSLVFFLPPQAKGQVRVQAQGPQGMPLPQAAERTRENDIYKVNFPIKPGQTEFDVSYVLPVGTPFALPGRAGGVKGMASAPVRLIAPPGVTLAGKDLDKAGTEPKTQATIYTVTTMGDYTAEITGIGSLHRAEPTQPDSSDEPQVTEGFPRIYRHLGWLLGLAFATLAIGLLVLFRTSPVRPR